VALNAGLGSGRLGLGCAPLGNLYSAVDDTTAEAVVQAAWAVGIRLFDTAPLYGHGLSEQRLGRALAGLPRHEAVVSSKVGRVLVEGDPGPTIFAGVPRVRPRFDFSRDGVLRSIETSLARLGLDRLDVVHVHDPDDHEHEALDGAFPTLVELRQQGVIGAVGCGMNQAEMLRRYVDRVDLDVILLAGRWSILDHAVAARALLDRCVERGVGVLAGGVLNSGLLAGGETFDYEPADAARRAAADRLRAACARHGVDLLAAALQFPARHPAVHTVLVGARSDAEVTADADAFRRRLPDALWADPALA
jgi:D-threo-aldose 1-dehydrogenase